MSGRFDRLDAKRCLPWSALLFRTLVAELAAPLGTWDRGETFRSQLGPVRPGHGPHPQCRPDGRAHQPLLSQGREAWVMYAFTEEKAHRQALYCEGQCHRLLVAYCHPSLARHHRSRSPATRVLSLVELANKAGTLADFLPQIRFLTNHMRMADALADAASVSSATEALQRASGPMRIETSELREARAALGMEVRTFGDAAYAFAAANLLNAATNRRAGLYQGSQRIPKEVYSFKSQVGRWIVHARPEPRPPANVSG